MLLASLSFSKVVIDILPTNNSDLILTAHRYFVQQSLKIFYQRIPTSSLWLLQLDMVTLFSNIRRYFTNEYLFPDIHRKDIVSLFNSRWKHITNEYVFPHSHNKASLPFSTVIEDTNEYRFPDSHSKTLLSIFNSRWRYFTSNYFSPILTARHRYLFSVSLEDILPTNTFSLTLTTRHCYLVE